MDEERRRSKSGTMSICQSQRKSPGSLPFISINTERHAPQATTREGEGWEAKTRFIILLSCGGR